MAGAVYWKKRRGTDFYFDCRHSFLTYAIEISKMRRNVIICLLLAGITLALYWPVGGLGFIGYDDLDYVYQNPVVQSGLNLQSFVWAFTVAHAGNWHPITWLSHMLDCELFGLNPGEAHGMNLAWHTVNAILLFLW